MRAFVCSRIIRLLSDGRGTYNDTYRVVVTTWVKRAAAVRLRVLTDESLPNNEGLASNGNFVLTDFEVLADGAGSAVCAYSGS